MRSLDSPAVVRTAAVLFFAVLVASGLAVHRDYGVGWDEPVQRWFGQTVYDHLRGQGEVLPQMQYYGPIVELGLAAAEQTIDGDDTRRVYFLRHALTFLLFCAGVYGFYRLATLLHGDARWGLFAAALLAASPRIYADAFVNSKDVPLMVFFICSMLTLVRLARRPHWRTAVAHGLMCALAIDARVVGVMTVVLSALFGALALATAPVAQRRTLLTAGAGSVVATAAFTVALWPLLWPDPARHFLDAVHQASHYPWPGKVLYFGERILASELPWHYAPVWIVITTPLAYLVLAGLGALADGSRLLRQPLRVDVPERALPLLWLLVPTLLILAQKAVLYDGWRHLFFIYPALLLLAVAGTRALLAAARRVRPALGYAAGGVLALAWLSVLVAMTRNHPHQNVYFNALVDRETARAQFDLDYWGLSYRKGLEAIVAHDSRPLIELFVTEDGGRYGAFLLPLADRRRIAFVRDPSDADYVLTTFRFHSGDYPLPEVFAVTVNRMKIFAVYRLAPS